MVFTRGNSYSIKCCSMMSSISYTCNAPLRHNVCFILTKVFAPFMNNFLISSHFILHRCRSLSLLVAMRISMRRLAELSGVLRPFSSATVASTKGSRFVVHLEDKFSYCLAIFLVFAFIPCTGNWEMMFSRYPCPYIIFATRLTFAPEVLISFCA